MRNWRLWPFTLKLLSWKKKYHPAKKSSVFSSGYALPIMIKNTVLYTRHIANKERIFPFAVSASGSFKTQVKPVSKNRCKVFISIISNWNYEILVFKGSYGKTGMPGVNPQWGKGENPETTNSTYVRRPHRHLNPGHMHCWKASALATSSPSTSWALLTRLKAEIKTVRQKVDENSWGFLSLGYP